MNSIFSRRSIRNYQDLPVSEESLERILKAGMQAPSAANQRPWEFIIVRDEARREELSGISPYAGAVKKAPVSLILLGNTKDLMFPQYWEQEMGACAQNILLQAVEEGLGAVWLGVCPDEDRVEYIKKMYDLPSHIVPFCVIPLGVPLEGKGNRELDRFEAERIHSESY